jgi:hypothetical protein
VAADSILTDTITDGQGQLLSCQGMTEPAPGNVFRWALREIRDLHGNGVKFTYDFACDPGISGGSVPGYQLYLKSINYTQSSGAEGPYSVTFTRDSELRDPKNPNDPNARRPM